MARELELKIVVLVIDAAERDLHITPSEKMVYSLHFKEEAYKEIIDFCEKNRSEMWRQDHSAGDSELAKFIQGVATTIRIRLANRQQKPVYWRIMEGPLVGLSWFLGLDEINRARMGMQLTTADIMGYQRCLPQILYQSYGADPNHPFIDGDIWHREVYLDSLTKDRQKHSS